MKTEIFKSYEDFLEREDKDVNGVSEYHALEYPSFEEDNSSNKGCWNCSDCSDCSYCSSCSSCSYCSYCSSCRSCSYCSYCSDCRSCRSCSYCSYCSYCSDCSDKNKNDGVEENKMNIPVIENIHQKVLDAVTNENHILDMGSWHGNDGNFCGTTHCRAGWVVNLAGEEGKRLESETDTPFAAMQIYKKSSPIKVAPTRFFESNEVAMADIERCAKEESQIIIE